jgi:DNA-binding NarL/FixJ family response regulator
MHTLFPPDSGASAGRKRRVLIVDDHDFFAACLRTLLDNESDLVVCDITTTSTELGARIERLKPDLLVLDLSLGTESGLELGQRLRKMQITTPILFTSALGHPTEEQLVRIPNSAFVAKGRRTAEFLAALRAVLAPSACVPERLNVSAGFAPLAERA